MIKKYHFTGYKGHPNINLSLFPCYYVGGAWEAYKTTGYLRVAAAQINCWATPGAQTGEARRINQLMSATNVLALPTIGFLSSSASS